MANAQTDNDFFEISDREYKIVEEIAMRCLKEFEALDENAPDSERVKINIEMSVIAAYNHNEPKMNLVKLLESEEFDFMHDIAGISKHIDTKTGILGGCFIPRCARGIS